MASLEVSRTSERRFPKNVVLPDANGIVLLHNIILDVPVWTYIIQIITITINTHKHIPMKTCLISICIRRQYQQVGYVVGGWLAGICDVAGHWFALVGCLILAAAYSSHGRSACFTCCKHHLTSRSICCRQPPTPLQGDIRRCNTGMCDLSWISYAHYVLDVSRHYKL